MAKAVRFFDGNTTHGNHVEAAESIHGNWFIRYYEYNGHGMAWGKWTAFEPEFTCTGFNEIMNQEVTFDKPRLTHGWHKMNEYEGSMPRVRLPE